MIELKDRTIAALVTEDYRMAEVFKRNGIDFCCGGGKTVGEACKTKGVDFDELEKELGQAVESSMPEESTNFDKWGLVELVDYIIEKHHSYVRQNVPLILEFAQKVATVHGHAYPEVIKIAELFQEAAKELGPHMMKEENILFPYIKDLVNARNSEKSTESMFGLVQGPISMMTMEHESVGDIMKEIRKLSGNYIPPLHACNTFKVEFFKLKEFEEDLHQHIHLENNILFPKAIALEKSLTRE